MIAGQMIQNLTGQREVIDGGRIEGTTRRRIFNVLPNMTYTGEAIPEWAWGCPSLHRLVVTGRVKCFNREPDPVVEEVAAKVAAPSADVMALVEALREAREDRERSEARAVKAEAVAADLVSRFEALEKRLAEPAPIPGGRKPKE